MKKTTKNTSLISPSKSIPLTILHTTLIIIINRSYILGFVKQLVMIGAGVKEDELQVNIIIFIIIFISIFIIIIINIIREVFKNPIHGKIPLRGYSCVFMSIT